MVSDAIQMGALALQETNQKRREDIHPKLKPSFQSLCNKPENEHGNFLFMNNLSYDVRKISTSKSIAAQLAPQHPEDFFREAKPPILPLEAGKRKLQTAQQEANVPREVSELSTTTRHAISQNRKGEEMRETTKETKGRQIYTKAHC